VTIIRVATRRSQLALTQTRAIAALLKRNDPSLIVDEVQIVTMGDQIQDVPLNQLGGKGLFVSEVEAALLDGRADFAVHSLKDVPAEMAAGLVLACVPEREDARDVLVTRNGEQLDDLEAGARIGTSSLRRSCQLRRIRNDLEYAMLRGNVDSRLRKLDDGQYSAIVLAYAGLKRLGLSDRPLWPIPVELSVPAVGQGALAIQARADDRVMRERLWALDHRWTRAAVLAERAFLRRLGGDCSTPLGGHARFDQEGSRLRFDAMVGAINGDEQIRAGAERFFKETASELEAVAEALGLEVAELLLSQGGSRLIDDAKRASPRHDPRRAPS